MLIVNYMLSYVNSIRQNLWKLCRSCFALREAVQLLEILLRILEKNQNILKFAKTVIFIEYYYYSSGRCSVLPPPRLGGVGILGFFWGGGGVKVFLISVGGWPMRNLYFFWGGQFIVRVFSYFGMQDLEISKIFTCGALIFNIHIFRFKIHAVLQVDIEFNFESKFSC